MNRISLELHTKHFHHGQLVWTTRARRDLFEIDAYIAVDNPESAVQWLDKLLNSAQRAVQLPMSGHMVRELGREDIRQLLVGSYRIVYRVQDHQIDILTVFEGHALLTGSESF